MAVYNNADTTEYSIFRFRRFVYIGFSRYFKEVLTMEFNDIITAISTVGFPIIACGGLFYLYDRTIKDLTTVLNKIDNTNQMILDLVKESRIDKNA